MKRLTLIAAVGIEACLFSCRTQKAVTTIDQDSSLSYVDTTKTAADTASHKVNAIDTTKITTAFEGNNVIEFVEGGGKVSIDPAGNMTLEGVKNMRGQHKGCIAQEKGVSQQVEDTAAYHEQVNGVEAKKTDRQKCTEEKTTAKKWYETALARLGLGVCIAALLWVLFLYLRRKR